MSAHPILLVAWVGLLWYVGAHRDPHARWTVREVVGAALLAVAVAVLCDRWLAGRWLLGHPYTGADFLQYCAGTAAIRDGDAGAFPANRSWFAGWFPAQLARGTDVLTALHMGAVGSVGVIAAAMYTWARVLAGRQAGFAAAAMVCAVSPIVLLTHTVTFYPEAIAGLVLASAMTAVAIETASVLGAALAGVAIGAALLVDVRGVVWLGCSALVLGSLARGQQRARRLAALLAPIVGSWLLANAVLPRDTPGLIYQMSANIEEVRRNAGITAPLPWVRDFRWGMEVDVLEAARGVRQLLAFVPNVPTDELVFARRLWLEPWAPVLLGAALIAIGVIRRPWGLIALFGPLMPFAFATWAAASTLGHPRYFALGLAGVPVLLGVACGVGRGRRKWAGIAVIAVMLLGPSWLGVGAAWRPSMRAEEYPARLFDGSAPRPEETVCRALLAGRK